jgi:methanogenic corrinoid protein MtbC1
VAIATFDSAQLESLILHATGMGALSSVEMCDRVLMPLLAEIGDRWEKGELDIAAEHFGSSIVRRHLHVLVQDESRRHAGAPAIVCACLEGDMHEGGLLGFALHAAVLGWAIVYLGANTPIEETISAAGRGTVAGIGLSVTREMKRQERRDLVERLAAWRNKRPGRVVWLGGSAARAHAQEFSAAGLEVLQDGRDLARGRPKA